MKHRQLIVRSRRQSRRFKIGTKRSAIIFIAVLMLVGVMAPMFSSAPVEAIDNSAKIRALEAQIGTYNDRARELAAQSDSLSKAIDVLKNEQSQLQAEIDLNNAKAADLKVKIAANEAKMKTRGNDLSEIMAEMYLDNKITPLEMLASSSNLSDYVDKQSQQATVQDQLKAAIQEIKELKAQLEQQKKDVEAILADQQTRRSQLASKQSEQQSLLDKTQGQEAAYAKMTAENRDKIRQLQAEQARANQTSTGGGRVVAGDPNHGGYPAYLNNAAKDALVDPWGMYNRECVSYAAWKVYQAYGNMPYWGGRGNANQWDDNARAAGIPTGSTPKVKAVAVWHIGYYGHVAWVEKVNGDGTFDVSEYNRGGDGLYHERTGVSTSGVVFIYFGER
ncbi:MAG: CHAP domain-containing protein [Sphaerimonospora mesophila]